MNNLMILDVATIHHYIESSVSGLSLVFNLLLLYLIASHAKSKVKDYQIVLTMTCLSDICLGVVIFAIQPVICSAITSKNFK